MKNKKRYKFNTGIQRIEMDTPDYSEAYAFKQQKLAKEKAGENIGVAVANTAVPGLGSGMQAASTLTDAMFKDSKGNYKNKTSELLSNQLNPLGKAGKAFSALTGDKSAAADLWSGSLVGTGLGALGMKNPFGKTSQEEGKEIQDRIERENMLANNAKRYSIDSTTDAQTTIAKKGKYKVKSKQPRMIETEGREPIFSPKKADGSRDLLYYNPNDPTHEEGGVKAVVMPKAEYGKKDLTYKSKGLPEIVVTAKKKPVKDESLVNRKDALDLLTSKSFSNIPLFKNDTLPFEILRNRLLKDKAQKGKKETLPHVKPLPGVYEMEEARRIASSKEVSKRKTKIPLINEALVVGRSGKNKGYALQPFFNKNTDTWVEDLSEIFDPTGITSYDDLERSWEDYQKNPDILGNKFSLAVDALASIPVAGKLATPFKVTRKILSKVGKKTRQAVDIGEKVFTPTIGTLNKVKKIARQASKYADELGDYYSGMDIVDKITEKDKKTTKDLIKAYGAKQLKVNTLNNTALSSNLTGMPAVNAANKFVQPLAGIQQVARNIPEVRRKEKINTPRSHKKINPDTNRIIDPPMLYEMKPPPPRSTFNTKNNFQDGVNKLEGDLISKVVMNRNKDKDFVKRTKATNMFKKWEDFDTKATHLMKYGEDDKGQSYMYPSIMNPNNEAIKVPNQYADYISKEGYKKATGMNKGSKKVKVYR